MTNVSQRGLMAQLKTQLLGDIFILCPIVLHGWSDLDQNSLWQCLETSEVRCLLRYDPSHGFWTVNFFLQVHLLFLCITTGIQSLMMTLTYSFFLLCNNLINDLLSNTLLKKSIVWALTGSAVAVERLDGSKYWSEFSTECRMCATLHIIFSKRSICFLSWRLQFNCCPYFPRQSHGNGR